MPHGNVSFKTLHRQGWNKSGNSEHKIASFFLVTSNYRKLGWHLDGIVDLLYHSPNSSRPQIWRLHSPDWTMVRIGFAFGKCVCMKFVSIFNIILCQKIILSMILTCWRHFSVFAGVESYTTVVFPRLKGYCLNWEVALWFLRSSFVGCEGVGVGNDTEDGVKDGMCFVGLGTFLGR